MFSFDDCQTEEEVSEQILKWVETQSALSVITVDSLIRKKILPRNADGIMMILSPFRGEKVGHLFLHRLKYFDDVWLNDKALCLGLFLFDSYAKELVFDPEILQYLMTKVHQAFTTLGDDLCEEMRDYLNI